MVEPFRQQFDRCAGVVRRRLAARLVLSLVSAGWTLGALVGLLGWLLGRSGLVGAAIALGTPLAALFLACRRRWSDRDVALYLDARLAQDESVSTALALDPATAAYPAVVARAATVLASAPGARVRPPFLRRGHGLAPVALAGIVIGLVAPPRARAVAARAPGTDVVRADSVPGLVRVERVRELASANPAQRARLERIAEDARRLREQLHGRGLERREALARVAELRERVAAERMAFASPEERRGLEAAIQRLQSAGLGDAARALGDHDREALDRATEREANRVEQADRARARQALQDAEDAARRNGASEVASALREQRERAAEREARDAVLERLAQAMGADAQVTAALQRFERERTDEAARDLARAIGASMDRMNDAQRRQLAERLRQSAGAGASHGGASSSGSQRGSDGAPDANATLRSIADALEGRGSQASRGGSSASSQLPQGPGGMPSGGDSGALGDAENGAQSAETQLGGSGGAGSPGAGSQAGEGQQGSAGGGSGRSRGEGSGSGAGSAGSEGAGAGGGSGPGGGAGGHGGATAPVVGGETVRAQARAGVHGGVPQPGGTTTLAPGRAGERANVLGTGELRGVAPAEIQGVESSQVPSEYRDQVRQYFRP